MFQIQDDIVVEMDPVSRARVADFVRNTTGLMQIPEEINRTCDRSMSISPDILEENSQDTTLNENSSLHFYMNTQERNYMLCLISLCKKQTQNYNFPVL